MIRVAETMGLVPGFHGERIDFVFRPYQDRSPEQQREYQELRADIDANGIRNPLITYRGHVLVGQRRLTIAKELGIQFVYCIEVEEDVSQWWQDHQAKLDAIKARYYTD